ncbi:hypothetical protein QFC21_005814 [Naganishia friedmannii]|uniref:Uncharacterized protein n=1 Tax=Naganishia friedmannii TaxID=89922 RepID=A0ACC2V8P6_9TREE|nr:hypothetical protein QFC21_005814 [Naganishia friedmannii]
MPFGQSAASTPSASTSATSDPQNRYRNIRYKSDIYVEDVPFESYTRDPKDFKIVSDGNEAIVIDNGTSHLRAGFASHSQPYINEPNQAAKFTSRKSVRTVMYGRDCEMDNTAKGYIKPIFDGDILLTNELLETALDYSFHHLSPLSSPLSAGPSSIPHPVIMTERLASPLYSRSITSELLFEAYSVPSVTYGVDSLFAFEGIQARRKGLLSSVGQSRSVSGRSSKRGQHGTAFKESAAAGESGLVINMGNMSTTLIPIFNGKSMMNRAKRIPWGGSQASDLTLRLMQLKYPGFPMRVSPRQASYIAHRTLRFATDYEAELSTLSDPSVMAKESTSVQFPYPVPDVVHRSEEELAALAEKRKEQGKKLQEITQKRNREKTEKNQSDLLGLKDVLDSKANMIEEEFEDALSQVGYQNEQELVRDVKDLERKVKAARQRAGEVEEEIEELPSFPLVNVPDSELDPEQKQEKRKQRMLKANFDSRIKAKAEKQAEKERLGEIERKDDEARDADFQGWADKLKLDHAATMTRMRERKKRKALLTNRKSAAAQGRMKQISELAADTPVGGRKRRRGGEADDDFGADDDDWAVYREIDGAEEVDEEIIDQDRLQEIEARLLKYDPSFTVEDTMEAIANRQSALVHAFLRGNELQRGVSSKQNGDEAGGVERGEDDARSMSLDLGNATEAANQHQQQEEELARAYRLHLNVEKIRIPEVWFQPSIAGVDCAGIAELAGYMLNSFAEEDKKKMMQQLDFQTQCIYVTGGCSLIPNIKARLERDLTSVLPFRAPLNVITDNSIPTDWPIAAEWPTDPRLSAWQGMAHWARTEESQNAKVSRAEWEECGGSWLKEHRWSNWWDEGHYVD